MSLLQSQQRAQALHLHLLPQSLVCFLATVVSSYPSTQLIAGQDTAEVSFKAHSTPTGPTRYHQACQLTKHQSTRRPLSQPSRTKSRTGTAAAAAAAAAIRGTRKFHEYFVTHLPSSSLHPDSRSPPGPRHKLPRDASIPHTPSPGSSPAAAPPNVGHRDLTVVRIPLRRAKHHFGAVTARGTRPYNEDTNQAGTIAMPAFARRPPVSLSRAAPLQKPGEAVPADSAFGDPQIFYFAVFDGHGGNQCSEFLRNELHGYIEEASAEFGLQSSLRKSVGPDTGYGLTMPRPLSRGMREDAEKDENGKNKDDEAVNKTSPDPDDNSKSSHKQSSKIGGMPPEPADVYDGRKASRLEKALVEDYRNAIGGYYRRFHPEYFRLSHDESKTAPTTVEAVLMYAFLRADLDFILAQAGKPDPDDPRLSDNPLNNDEILGAPHAPPSGHTIGGRTRFKGGSTASIALISTPTPAPFWHPATSSTLLVAHVGDSRVLLCETSTGVARPLTSDHHPSMPVESRRLRRYAPAGSMVSGDSFGEERIMGLANSRAFGDVGSKRIGVSAEPEITRTELGPAQYSFIVLMSDGVSGSMSDQEIVDIVKEARTPEEGARHVVEYATEVSNDGDNATCQVLRLGGWERRSEGGLGSFGTKEIRDMRRAEALDPRRGKR